ncbi:ArsR/SmtB family transcription factor [Nocardioides sp.]
MPITTTVGDDPGLRRGAALFHGLADRTRLAIVRQLAEAELRVVDLTRNLGLAQGTVSGHLACLRECGLVVGRPEGRQMFYGLAHPELFDLLSSAEQLLALTGDAVELCPNYGDPVDSDTSISPTKQEHAR